MKRRCLRRVAKSVQVGKLTARMTRFGILSRAFTYASKRSVSASRSLRLKAPLGSSSRQFRSARSVMRSIPASSVLPLPPEQDEQRADGDEAEPGHRARRHPAWHRGKRRGANELAVEGLALRRLPAVLAALERQRDENADHDDERARRDDEQRVLQAHAVGHPHRQPRQPEEQEDDEGERRDGGQRDAEAKPAP